MRMLLKSAFAVAALGLSALATGCASTTTIDSGDQEAMARFEDFQSGKAKLVAGQMGSWGANSANARALFDKAKWRELADLVQRTGPDKDLTWYYLGSAAKGLGFDNVARVYFERSIEEEKSTRPGHRCNAVFDLCDGFVFPAAA